MKIKTIISFIILFTLSASQANARISVVCTLFPVYDFARNITGSLADVKLLLPPGTEPHEYEPSPKDIKALNDSDVFIFTGPQMEEWAERIARSLSHTHAVNASDGIVLADNDPHVWLDLSLALKMSENILVALCNVDPDNSQAYKLNFESLTAELNELDGKFLSLKKDKTLVFAGEFSAGYFMRRYGFDYISAYDGENEPSVKRMADVLKFIQQNRTKYIFADYGGISQVTRTISDETGTKILTFGTGHNVPDNDMTFLQMMRENYENIQEAVND
ncbi:MAG: zinc ABC transporter substrate-binding protein [Synergistaceae bacterium]|nr:zinc ABC transporter substrate-binding protein [Synergistaceae bacterium]